MDINEVFRGGGRSVEFLDQINKASIVMLDEAGILPHGLAARIAIGIASLIEHDQQAPPRSSADYLDYEPRLTALIGADASRLHTGRSRQDIASTIARMNLRDGVLRSLEALLAARDAIVTFAEQHIETIIPAYTHGVQAQPTTLAHYLHAFAAALARAFERLQQAYQRVNRNPLGAAALATSSFPLDRNRLAELLGFEGLVENAYDANHLAPIDSALDVAGAWSIAAVQIGQCAQDLHAQYAEPVPWMLLGSAELTGVSSIMPQKRNPAALEQLRAQASLMLADMQSVTLLAHNTRTGMFDYRSYDPVPCARPLQVFKLLAQVVATLVVNKARALEEVRADYSTATELADALMQKCDVPFRIGHHFASKLTDHGRGKGIALKDISYSEAAHLYEADTGTALPLNESEYHDAISAETMVFGRRGIGGPQRSEMERMLNEERVLLALHGAWLSQRRDDLSQADAGLTEAFSALLRG
jgi:argininosuccinate lyase